jgi:outer membrane protein assembly factor BamB
VRRSDGYIRWTENLGRLAASSPACDRKTVYAVILQRGRSKKSGGLIAAIEARKGRIRWSRRLASRSESSPLLDRGMLFFGSESGRIYALNARTGAVRWTYDAGGAVKGGLALAAGKLYFGDYSGRLTALRRDNGRKLWRVDLAKGGPLGVGAGNLYSTPAAAYGRVFIGSTNGFVYSVSQRNGRLAWRYRTRGYVYSSPAVGPFGGGTVYVGSYDGKLYALNARSGAVRWTRKSGGKLSGGVTVIGDTVLYANLKRQSIAAVGAATGRLIWSFDRGGFDPGISDGEHYYLLGYSSIYMFENREVYRRQRDRK